MEVVILNDPELSGWAGRERVCVWKLFQEVSTMGASVMVLVERAEREFVNLNLLTFLHEKTVTYTDWNKNFFRTAVCFVTSCIPNI